VDAPNDIPESEAFIDCSGQQRVFSLECHHVPTGWAVTATEVSDNDFGYRFEGFSASNPYLALGQVRAKVRAGLATTSRGGHGHASLIGSSVFARPRT
jgi:hypothetical protein